MTTPQDEVAEVLAIAEQRMLQMGVTKVGEESMLAAVMMATLVVELKHIAALLDRIDNSINRVAR